MSHQGLSVKTHRVALAALFVLPLGGCGGFVTENGIFPLPTIHEVNPLPSAFGLAYEDVRLNASNGLPLFGWFIPAENARGTVLIHHGAVVNRSGLSGHYQLFHELGFHVFVYDYQGFGESPVLATINTVLPDADAALAYVQNLTRPGTEQVILYGASMGTLPTFAQAARNPAKVVAIIVEGSFLPNDLPPFAFYFLGIMPSPEAFLRIPAPLNPESNVAQVTLPKLFLHSRTDNLTLFADAETLFNLAPQPKEFHEVLGGHIGGLFQDPAYREIMAVFLDELFPPA